MLLHVIVNSMPVGSHGGNSQNTKTHETNEANLELPLQIELRYNHSGQYGKNQVSENIEDYYLRQLKPER